MFVGRQKARQTLQWAFTAFWPSASIHPFPDGSHFQTYLSSHLCSHGSSGAHSGDTAPDPGLITSTYCTSPGPLWLVEGWACYPVGYHVTFAGISVKKMFPLLQSICSERTRIWVTAATFWRWEETPPRKGACMKETDPSDRGREETWWPGLSP